MVEVTSFHHGSNTGIVDFVYVVGMRIVNRMCRDGGGIIVFVSSKIVIVFIVLLSRDSSNDLELAAEDHGESITSHGLFNPRHTGAITPFVYFTTKSVGFMFEDAELAGRENSVTTRGMDVGNGGVDDGRFRGTTDLRQIRQESGKVLKMQGR
jgi:hypothetical protein